MSADLAPKTLPFPNGFTAPIAREAFASPTGRAGRSRLRGGGGERERRRGRLGSRPEPVRALQPHLSGWLRPARRHRQSRLRPARPSTPRRWSPGSRCTPHPMVPSDDPEGAPSAAAAPGLPWRACRSSRPRSPGALLASLRARRRPRPRLSSLRARRRLRPPPQQPPLAEAPAASPPGARRTAAASARGQPAPRRPAGWLNAADWARCELGSLGWL